MNFGPSLKKIVTDIFISISIALALMFVVESGLRILYPEKVLDIAEERRRIQQLAYRYHPDYLVALKPNITKTFNRDRVNGGDVIHWKTNSDSFRGNELRPQHELRVIVYGDSNIQARFSRLEHTFANILENHLKSISGKDVEVINGGIVGAGPDQNLIRFSLEVDIYKPDVVIFHIFADNDFGDIIRNRLVEVDHDGVLVRTDFKPTTDQLLENKESHLLVTKAALKVVNAVSGRLASLKSDPVDAAATPAVANADPWISNHMEITNWQYTVYKNKQPRLASHFADAYDIDVALFPDSESVETKIRLLTAVLKQVRMLAEKKGVELLVLIQPTSRDMTQNISPNYSDFQQYPGYSRDRLSSIVDQICSRLDIKRFNLYPTFFNNNPSSLFFKEPDGHWNDAGQALAAREVANYISNKILTGHSSAE